ncbi:MAG TPA: FUSC family protein [Mycobacteriales bacterium]|nr:FUSC family protein [Mycobacteriales bacterium]
MVVERAKGRLIRQLVGELRDPGLLRLRGAIVSLAAALASFGCALFLDRRYHLTTSSVVLAVVLALTLGRADRGHARSLPHSLVAPLLLPFLAVGATEVGQRLFTHPNLGDTLFVVGMAFAIWVRQYGARARQVGGLIGAALTAVLITPGPAVPLGGHVPSRWWAALIALIALGWTRAMHAVAERTGFATRALAERPPHAMALPKAPAVARRWHRRVPATTKLALQMGVALAAAFACGREAFGLHWTWVVLSAYIVGSGNRGRGDVAHKAVLRLVGAACGTLLATALSGAFAAGDDWSIVALFAVVAVALWLRPLSYAYWAAGMTAALALLYDFYGEVGHHLLVTRLEGILLGASIAVVAAWIVLPVRNVDVIRRQLATAFATLAGVVGRGPEATFDASEIATYAGAVKLGDLAAASLHILRHLPRRWRVALPYATACRALALALPEPFRGSPVGLAMTRESQQALAADVTSARRALAATATDEQRDALGNTAERIAEVLQASYCWRYR